MRVLLIGSRGRTQAIARTLTKNKNVTVYALMDKLNNGIADLSFHYEVDDIADLDVIDDFVEKNKIEMIVVVSVKTLLKGAVNYFNEIGIPTIGPSALCTWLEADKGFLRSLMQDNDIEGNPDFMVFFEKEQALDYISQADFALVVKPAGITLQAGVRIEGIHLNDKSQTKAYVEEIFDQNIGNMPCVVLEPKLLGQEYVVQVLTDGKTVVPFPVVKEFNLLNDPVTVNAPGMGSYSDASHMLPFLDQQSLDDSLLIIRRILTALREQYSENYKGFLSAKFMITHQGIRLLGINVGPDDPAALNVLPLLKTDLLEIFRAIATEGLDEIAVEFEPLATVCKYVVPNESAMTNSNILIQIDDQKIADLGINLWQSCFQVQDNVYQPGPRLFAISATGRSFEEAYRKCNRGLNCLKCIHTEQHQKYGKIR
ncbi:MAG: hypothetical protein R6U64_08690 [Bacteroidales bacterium]